MKHTLLAIGYLIASVFPLSASSVIASSWDPTLLVNTEAFQELDEGDGSSDIYVQFGSSLTRQLTFDVSEDRFNFSDDLHIEGNITGSGGLVVDGTVIINNDGDASNFRIETDNNENTVFVDGANDKVGIGHSTPESELDVLGTISGSNLTVRELEGCSYLNTNAVGDVQCQTTPIIGGGGGSLDDAYNSDTLERTITVDSGNVSWDLTSINNFIIDPLGTGGVGIGTDLPSTELEVSGTTTTTNLSTTATTTTNDLVVTDKVASDLTPETDLTYDLGEPALRWNTIYVGSIELSNDDDDDQAVDLGQGGITVTLTNSELGVGTTIESGSVIKIDASSVDSVILTTSKNDSPIGVATNASGFGEDVDVLIIGKATVKCTGSITVGDLIQTSNTDGAAQAGGNSTKVLGNALTTCTSGTLRAIVHLE